MGRKELEKLWVTIVVAICLLISQVHCNDNINCPTACLCKTQNFVTNMYCNSLFSENEAPNRNYVANFAITNSKTPLYLPEKIFVKLGLTQVKSITISNSTIAHIDKTAFVGLNDLTDVRMEHVKLSNIHPDVFATNQLLQKVKFSHTHLPTNTSFRSESIEELVMSQCNITEITTNLFKSVSNLIMIDLNDNQIQVLPPDAFQYLENIQEIHLSNNNITEIPEDIFMNCFDLETLDLSGNPISVLPPVKFEDLLSLNLKSCMLNYINDVMFTTVSDLDNIDLSYNKIMHIEPNAFSKFQTISYINIAGNRLKTIHENVFFNNLMLRRINLDNNPLQSLPKNGFKNNEGFENLYFFSCNNCELRSLPETSLQNLRALVVVRLSHNKISDISTGVFRHLENLIELDLSRNQITTIDDKTFKYNNKLKSISLAHNPLKALHASMFANNMHLSTVDLSNCGLFKLWTLSVAPERLSSIETLNISHNRIALLTDRDIQVTDHLKSLDLTGNPLKCTDGLKSLTLYLDQKNIKKTAFKHNDEIIEGLNMLDNKALSWRQFLRKNCGFLADAVEHENDENDDDYSYYYYDDAGEDYYGDDKEKTEDAQESKSKVVVGKHFRDSMHLLPDPDLGYEEHYHTHYTVLWPVLVFTGTAFVVLAIATKALLFIVNRRQNIPVTRFMRFPATSKLGKNSNLVYHQLSEERDTVATPVLSRFTLIPSVHVGQAKPADTNTDTSA